jgi:CheY-like chemotaxis protein
MMDLSHIQFHLVDDNDIDIAVNVKLLHLAKISDHISTYTSAVKFLDFIEQHSENFKTGVHVVLLDIMMPVMNGFECLEALEKLDASIVQNINVFMLSSSIDRNNIMKAEKHAIVKRVIEKPLDVYLLKMALEDVYGQ